MYIDYLTGSPLWYWYVSGWAIAGFALSAVLTTMVIGLANWKAWGIFLKTITTAAALSTMPLGLARLGFLMAIDNPEIVGILSIGGTAVAVTIGLAYLITRAISKNSNPELSPVGVDANTMTVNAPSLLEIEPKEEGEKSLNTPEVNFLMGNGKSVSVNSNTVLIGRDESNDVVLDDPSVSRRHAEVKFENGRGYVQDLDSLNGMTVDGVKQERCEIREGSTMTLGKVNLEIGHSVQQNVDPEPISLNNVPAPINATFVGKPKAKKIGWLTVNGGDNAGDMYYLKNGNNTIGRNNTNDFVLDDPFTSSTHALIKTDGTHAVIYDLGSRSGLKVNNCSISGKPIVQGSHIRIGDTRMQVLVVDSPDQFASPQNPNMTMVDRKGKKGIALVATTGPDAGKSFMIGEGQNHIGRNTDNNVRLSDGSVSRAHAMIRCEKGILTVFDLGSSTGTEVDGQRIGGLPVSTGDLITIGKTELTFVAAKP